MGKTFSTGLLTNGIWQDASNNIGIGGSPSGSYKLEVTGTAKVSSTLLVSGASTLSSTLQVGGTTSSTITIGDAVGSATDSNIRLRTGSTKYAWLIASQNNVAGFEITPSTAVGGTTFSTPALTILPTGNVGIGTTSPGQLLEVNGNILASQTGKIGFRYSSSNANYYSYLRSATGGGVGPIVLAGGFESGGGGNEAIRLCTNDGAGNERTALSINNAGTITIPGGATAANFNATNEFTLNKAGANGIGDGPYYRYVNATNAAQFLRQLNASSGEDLWTYTTSTAWTKVGNTNAGSGVYTPLSDINKKKDFELSTLGLDAILGLKPTLYRMKSENESTNKQLGFIAQDVKEFIPQAYIEEGEEDSKFIGLNYNAITATLVKAMQEQNQTIQNLQEQINIINNK